MEERQRDSRRDSNRRPSRSNYRGKGRNDRGRGGRNQGRGRDRERNEKVDNLLRKIREELAQSIEPIAIPNLNAFERKLVHRHFDHNPEIVTKTYRHEEEEYELRVYPVGNLKKFALDKAQEALDTRQAVTLPHMSNYERFVIHETLKDNDAIKTNSFGEGDERHVQIEPEMFGRGLKKIIKKIRLF